MMDINDDSLPDFPYGVLAFGRSISIIHRFSQKFVEQELKEYNINKAQMEILIVMLKSTKLLNQKEINSYFGYNKATVTKLINSLEEAGYVARIKGDQDKREKFLIFTEKGQKIKPVIIETLNKEEKYYGKLLCVEEEKFLRKSLYHIAEEVRKFENK